MYVKNLSATWLLPKQLQWKFFVNKIIEAWEQKILFLHIWYQAHSQLFFFFGGGGGGGGGCVPPPPLPHKKAFAIFTLKWSDLVHTRGEILANLRTFFSWLLLRACGILFKWSMKQYKRKEISLGLVKLCYKVYIHPFVYEELPFYQEFGIYKFYQSFHCICGLQNIQHSYIFLDSCIEVTQCLICLLKVLFIWLSVQFHEVPTCIQRFKAKVAATSLKLETRLHAYHVGMNTRSGTEVIFMHAHLVGSCVQNHATLHVILFQGKRWHSDFKISSCLTWTSRIFQHVYFPNLWRFLPLFLHAHH